MSNVGQVALDIVGAVAGYFISGGNPAGALLGFTIASGVGQALFPTQLPPVTGPRITDHATTTSALGDPVIIGYGTFPSTGTVNFLGQLIETPTTTQQGGKGGPVQSSTTYSYTQSIGIGLCETTSMNGVNVPILGLQRIWENGELVYDNRLQQPGELDADYAKRVAYTVAYAATFVLYLGTEDQEPDPTVELELSRPAVPLSSTGVGQVLYDVSGFIDNATGAINAPFFRGLAYIMYPNRVLRTDQGERHPTFKFEVLKAATAAPRVILPTYLSGADNADLQPDVLAVDPVNGRYYVQNVDTGHYAVLGFNLLNNTQFAQNDPGPSLTDAHGLAVSPDGFVIVAGAAELGRLDPLTLAVVNTAAYAGGGAADWEMYATATVNFGLGPIYILAAVGIINTVTLIDCVSLATIASFAIVDPQLAVGLYESGNAVFWVVSTGGSDISIHKIVCTGTSASDTVTHVFAPADIDATWTSINTIGDAIVDPNDGHLMFRVNGNAVFTSSHVVKCNGDTGVIDWVTTVPFSSSTSYGVGQSFISNDAWWLVDAIPDLYESINTVTGVATAVNVPGITIGGQNGASTTIGGLSGGAILANYGFSSDGWAVVLPSASTPGKVKIADIVADLCERSGLTSHDTSLLGDTTVDGYSIATTPMVARDAIVPLRSVGFFDSCETGDTMRFVRRGAAPAMTLLTTDLGAYETGTSTDPAPANAAVTSMESDLPQQIRLTYMSPARDYQPGQQLSLPRFDTLADQLTDVQLGGVCLDDDQAAQAAEILWNDAWASDHTYTFAVDQSKAALEPTDVVLVPMINALVRVRLATIDDASQVLRTVTAVSDDDGNYVSSAIAAPVPYRVTMRFHAGSTLVLMDTPLLLDSNDTGRTSAPLYLAVYPDSTDSWTGAAVLESDDAGATYTNVATATTAPATGTATTVLGDTPNAFLTDTTNSVTIQMQPGSTLPSSVTTAQLLDGANGAALIDPGGTVEVFQFRDAYVVSPGVVMLSYFQRGRRGTDTMTGNHAIGSRFVMLGVAGTVQKTNVALADLNSVLEWKAVGAGDTVAGVPTVPFADIGRSLMPYAPVRIRIAEVTGGDLEIGATRRARIGASEWIDGETDALPIAEDSEAWSVDIYSGSSVIRTISATSLPILYPAAQVAADFGSTPTSLTVALHQMSRQVGRGFAYKVIQPIGADIDGVPSVPPVLSRTATPTFSPASGTRFTGTQVVTIACATPGATIYYTTNGSTPTTASPSGTSVTLSISSTVQAIATASGFLTSAVGSASYALSSSSPVAPDAPTVGALSPLDGAVSLAFTPNGNGGSPILDYTITTNTGHSAVVTSSPGVVPGTPNGTAVTATVKARNVAGYSAPSAASNSATPVSSGGGAIPQNLRVLLQGETAANSTPTPPDPSSPDYQKLGWDAEAGASGYEVWRTDADGSTLSLYDTTATNDYADVAATECVSSVVGPSGPGLANYKANSYLYGIKSIIGGVRSGLSSTQSYDHFKNGNLFGIGGNFNSGVSENDACTVSPMGGSTQFTRITQTGAWGFWLPYSGNNYTEWNLYLAGVSYLDFWCRGSAGIHLGMMCLRSGDVNIYSAGGGDKSIHLSDYATFVPDTWIHYVIPIADILGDWSVSGAGPEVIQRAFYKFLFQDNNNAYGTWDFDNGLWRP